MACCMFSGVSSDSRDPYNIHDSTMDFVEHDAGKLQFSAYHFHHNREPFYLLFIKNGDGDKIYIEKIDEHSHRNKYVNDVVMPVEVMESNANLKKYYDMSVMLVNTDKTVYYDPVGFNSKRLISTYDTDSEDEDYDDDDDDEAEDDDKDDEETRELKKKEKERLEDIWKKEKEKKEEKRKLKRPIRYWCIHSDIVWKNMRVSTPSYYNCYYNINPFTFEYKLDTECVINNFISYFDSFAKYHGIPQMIVDTITANYNNNLRLTRS